MVSGWEMVPEVHELRLQDMVVVFLDHGAVELQVPGVVVPLTAYIGVQVLVVLRKLP